MDGYQGGMFPNQQGGRGGGGYNQQQGGNDYYQQQQQQQPQQQYGGQQQQHQGGYHQQQPQHYQNNPYQQQQQQPHYGGGGGYQGHGGGGGGGGYHQQQPQQTGGYHHHQGGNAGGYNQQQGYGGQQGGGYHNQQGSYGGGYQQQQQGGNYYQQQGGQYHGYGGGYGGRGRGRGRGGHFQQQGGQRDLQPREERKVNYVVVPVASVDDVKFIQDMGFYHVDQALHEEYVSGPFMKSCTVTLMFTVQEALVGKCVVNSVAKAKSEIPKDRAPNIERVPNDWSPFIFKVRDVSIFNEQVCLLLKDVRLPGVHTLNPLGHGFERFYPLHVVCDANLKAVFAALDAKPAHTEPVNFETLSADDALKMCQEDMQYMATICAAMYNPERYPAIIGKSEDDVISRPTPEWQGGFLQSALYSFNQAAIDDKNLAVTADGSFHTALILQSCFWGTSLDGHSGLLYYLSRELDAYHNPADPAARPICPVLAQFYGHPLLALSCTFRSIASDPELPLPNRDLRTQLMENFEPAAERCFHSYTCGRVLFALLCEVIGLPEENDPNILSAYRAKQDPTQREKRGRDDETGGLASQEIILVKATGAVSTTPPSQPPSAGKVEALTKILPVVAKEKILTQAWKHMQTSRMVQQTLPCIMDIIIRNHSALEEAACDIIRHLCVEHLLDVSMDQHGNYLTTAVFENIASRMDLKLGKENSPPAFYQVVMLLLEKIAGIEGKAMACSKTASNCLDNLLKSFIPVEKNTVATTVSPFQEVILEAFVRLFEMNPDAACDRFGNYTAQKLFDRVAPSATLVNRVLSINWPERHDMHLGGNCRSKLNGLKSRVEAERAAAAALAATSAPLEAVPPQ